MDFKGSEVQLFCPKNSSTVDQRERHDSGNVHGSNEYGFTPHEIWCWFSFSTYFIRYQGHSNLVKAVVYIMNRSSCLGQTYLVEVIMHRERLKVTTGQKLPRRCHLLLKQRHTSQNLRKSHRAKIKKLC